MSETIVVAIIGMFGACLASNGLWSFIQSVRSKRSPLEQMVYAIGRERLLRLSKKYIEQGYIPSDDFGTFVTLGEAYFALKGNSEVGAFYKEAMELPRK